jgi:hypothetical protein
MERFIITCDGCGRQINGDGRGMPFTEMLLVVQTIQPSGGDPGEGAANEPVAGTYEPSKHFCGWACLGAYAHR